MLRLMIFAGVMSTILALMNVYSYKRFFKKLHFAIDREAKIALIFLYGIELLFIAEMTLHILPSSLYLYWGIAGALGLTVVLFFSALLYDLLHSSARKLPYNESRRRFIKIVFDVTMLILLASYFLSGLFGGLEKPKLKAVKVKVRGKIRNFKIAQLSDVHIGRAINREFVEDLVSRINEQKVDMVALTGDLIDQELAFIKSALEPLKGLKSTYGTFFVSGNHEYFHNASEIIAYLKEMGIYVLDNRSMLIGEGEQRINIAGMNDIISKRIGVLEYDVEKTFEGVDPEYPTLFLSHQPKSVKVTKNMPYDLMLSGHTHGGQIFPFGLLVLLDQPYLAGLYDIDKNKQIYVSRGTGYWGPPIRVFAPSEITILTLN
jgi:uncharacterized protein